MPRVEIGYTGCTQEEIDARYKTEMCKNKPCHWGDACIFAHSVDELRPMPPREEAGKPWR